MAALAPGISLPAYGQFTAAEIPISGATNAVFDSLDIQITQYMEDKQISACEVGIMANGRVVYERGFGWRDYPGGDPTPVAENDVMRVASVTKPIIAAAVQKLIADGVINATDKVFDYASPGGLLPAATYYPYNGVLGDSRYADITVQDLIEHRGGWDVTVNASPWNGKAYDPQFSAIRIANEIDSVNPPLPPGRKNTVRFMMSQPLQYDPGATSGIPSSFGYGTAVNYTMGDEPRGVALGDLNGDTVPDMVTGNWLSGDVSVRLGNGDGTFGSAGAYTVGVNPQGVAIGDLNHDNKADVVVASNGDNAVSVLLGNGNGSLQTPDAYATGSLPTTVVIDDVNADNDPDILVTAFGGAKVWVHLGNGDGSFQTGAGYSAQNGPRTLVAYDMNKDGVKDIVCSNSNSDSFSILLGAGDGTFSLYSSTATGPQPFGIGVADLDGNGWGDVITANQGDNTFSVSLNDGASFAAPVAYPVGRVPRGLFVGDVDGDGKADAVTVDHDDSALSVSLGKGDGTFKTPTTFAVGTNPYYITGGDLDGDGRIDLAAANRTSDDASVLLRVPNGVYSYSNFGYMLLGLIIEQVMGQNHLDYIQSNFLDTWGGAPREMLHGRTFKQDQDPREPFYDGSKNATNVFCNPIPGDCSVCPCVDWAYGGWEHEVFRGHGDLVTDVDQLLHFADGYLMFSVYSNPVVEIGTPFDGSWYVSHNGSIEGTNALASNGIVNGGVPHPDNVRYAFIMNNRYKVDGDEPYVGLQTIIIDYLNARMGQMPTTYATDTWVDFSAGGGGSGTFASPKQTVTDALPLVQQNGRIKIKPGSTTWTGTVNAAVRLDAPLGTVRVGGP